MCVTYHDMVPSNRQLSRRSTLAIASGSLIGLAGCIDVFLDDQPQVPAVEEFPYPDGFTTDAIDLDVALGEHSAMAQASSLSLVSERTISFPFGTVDESILGRFDREAGRFRVESQTFDPMASELTLSERYHHDIRVVERMVVEPRSTQPRITQRRHVMSAIEDYRLDELRRLLNDVDLSVESTERFSPVSDEAKGDYEVPVVVYNAGTADIGQHAHLNQLSASFGAFDEGVLDLRVDEHGHVHRLDVLGEYTNREGEEISLEFTWEYFDFNNTSVEEPLWLSDAPSLELPVVEVSFDERPDGRVIISITSMEHTSTVGVTVAGEGLVETITEPGEIELTTDVYTDAQGRLKAVYVFAEDQFGGPIHVDSFQPTGR